MATVIDSLIITLGLDPSGFDKGRKQAAADLLATKAEAVKAASAVEEASKKTAEAIHKVGREVLALFAILIGGRGIKEFVTDLTRGALALNDLSFAMKTTPQDMAAWGFLSERIGGTVLGTAQSMRRLSDGIQAMKGGEASPIRDPILKLFGMSGKPLDLSKSMDDFWKDLNDAAYKAARRDPIMTNFLLRRMGLSDADARLVVKNPEEVARLLLLAKKLAPTQIEIKQLVELRDKWAEVTQTIGSVGDSIIAHLSGPMGEVIEKFRVWLEANREWLKEKVEEGFKRFGEVLKTVKEDIVVAWNFIKPVLVAIDDFVTNKLGGWHTVIEIFIGLSVAKWALSWAAGLLPLTASILALSAAFFLLEKSVEFLGKARAPVQKFFEPLTPEGKAKRRAGASIGTIAGGGYQPYGFDEGMKRWGETPGRSTQESRDRELGEEPWPEFGRHPHDRSTNRGRVIDRRADYFTGGTMSGTSSVEAFKIEEPMYRGILRALKEWKSLLDGMDKSGPSFGPSSPDDSGDKRGGAGNEKFTGSGPAVAQSGATQKGTVDMEHLTPEMRARFGKLQENMTKLGVPLRVTYGYRDLAHQQEIWERSGHGTRFAAAHPGHSRHGSGEAVDAVPGRGTMREYQLYHSEARKVGLQPLGMWDKVHVQMPRGGPHSELQQGVGARGIAALSPNRRVASNNTSSTALSIDNVSIQTGVAAAKAGPAEVSPVIARSSYTTLADYGMQG